MNKDVFFNDYFNIIGNKINSIDHELLKQTARLALAAHRKGGKLIFAGNGGSAAMASHLSVDFTKTAGIRAINFNEADLITCYANDYGYENWVAEAIRSYADPADVVVLISSSGRSANIINAARVAKSIGLAVVTVTGFSSDNPLSTLGDVNLWVDSSAYNVVEMTHHTWLLAVADYLIERAQRTPDASNA